MIFLDSCFYNFQRLYQYYFENAANKIDDKCSNEFFVISLGGSFLILTALSFMQKDANAGSISKSSIVCGFFAGICNGVANYLNLLVYLYIPISVATPLRSGISFIITFILTVFVYREKFTKKQLAGMILGMAAVILLKL